MEVLISRELLVPPLLLFIIMDLLTLLLLPALLVDFD
jgi:hypothetical protein